MRCSGDQPGALGVAAPVCPRPHANMRLRSSRPIPFARVGSAQRARTRACVSRAAARRGARASARAVRARQRIWPARTHFRLGRPLRDLTRDLSHLRRTGRYDSCTRMYLSSAVLAARGLFGRLVFSPRHDGVPRSRLVTGVSPTQLGRTALASATWSCAPPTASGGVGRLIRRSHRG